MNIITYSDNIDTYLCNDEIIDFKCESVSELADKISSVCTNETEYIKAAYEYVRDNISHSADINNDIITCSASEVLSAGHGICFAKSHLLVALLRNKSIPSGFCYQKLILDDDTAPILIFHGLAGVYLKEYDKWIRLDPRGNKEGVNAQFSIEHEQLAFPVRHEKGEEDIPFVYPLPDKCIVQTLTKCKTRTELWNDLPTKLKYLNQSK